MNTKFLYWSTRLTVLLVGLGLGWMGSVARYGLAIGLHPRPPGSPPAPPSRRMMKAAGLSDDQILALEKMAESNLGTIQRLGWTVLAKKNEFEEECERTTDEAVLRRKYAAFAAARAELEEIHFQSIKKSQSILTLDQLRKMKEQNRPPGFVPFGNPPGL